MGDSKYTTIAYENKLDEKPDETIVDCVGHIRPHPTYDKDLGYGFDWMRIGDTNYGGNSVAYKDIVGKLYRSLSTMDLVTDHNEYDDKKYTFRVEEEEFKLLEDEYNMATGARVFFKNSKGERERYYVPILALPRKADVERMKTPPVICNFDTGSGGKIAKAIAAGMMGARVGSIISKGSKEKYFVKLELRLTITKPPKKLFWEVPKQYKKSEGRKFTAEDQIEIKCTEIPVAVCTDKKIEFEIGCSAVVGDSIDIKLMAEKHNGKTQMVGVFRMWKNIAQRKKIVLAQVVTNISADDNTFKDQDLIKEGRYIQKYLSQALVIPQIEIVINFKMDGTGFFAKNHLNEFKSGEILLARNDYKPKLNLYSHLKENFDKGYSTDNNTVIIFFIKEDIRNLIKTSKGSDKPLFYAANLAGTNLIIYSSNEKRDSSGTHEILHAMGVLHTFTNRSVTTGGAIEKYTFKPLTTDNIMDYSKFHRFSLWKWQWETIK